VYTDDELEAAVLSFLTSDVTLSRSEQGTRDTAAVKTQVYELISSAFMLRPDALFSVCWLASNSLRALITQQLSDMQAVLAAAPRVSSVSAQISSVTDLRNAEASLLTLTAAFAARSSGVSGSIGPAIQRFSASVGSFMKNELAKNTVSGGDVTETPEELQARIATLWASAKPRHAQIQAAAGYFVNALADYNSVRLPSSVVGNLLVRIQTRLAALSLSMQGPTAAQDSRPALLEFSAMRVLLQQAAQFKTPVLRRGPLAGDASTGTAAGSAGLAAGVVGSVSGPFNYAPGTVLSYSVGASPGSLVLPGTSAAILRSQALAPWTNPPVGSQLALRLDGGSTLTVAATTWGSGSAAATALDAALAGVSVTWDSAATELVFHSENAGDASALSLLSDTSVRASFLGWLVGAGQANAQGQPVDAADVLQAFTADARLAASLTDDSPQFFTGQRSTAVGETAVLWHRVASGTDLAADGSTTVQVGADLEALGVTPGMVLVRVSPSASAVVLSVDGPLLVLETAMPAAAAAAYYVGPDYSADAGARVVLAGTADAGPYRVLSGGAAQLVLDRALTSAAAVQATLQAVRLEVALRSIGATLTLLLPTSAGASALGLTPQTARPSLSAFDTGMDLGARGAQIGDVLVLQHPSGGPTTHVVTSLSGTVVGVAPPILAEGASVVFELRDPLVNAYNQMCASLSSILADGVFRDVSVVDQVIGRLQRGARFTGSLVTTLTGYIADLLELQDLCDQYVVPRDPTVEQSLRLMAEQGFDRAADLFTALRLSEFFALDTDGVSYKSWVVRTSATAASLAQPVSKAAPDPINSFQTIAVQTVRKGGA
jgi:hypothetical protein